MGCFIFFYILKYTIYCMKISKEDKEVGFRIDEDIVYLFKSPTISIKLIEAIREKKKYASSKINYMKILKRKCQKKDYTNS
jgi:hypothetical protein